MTHPFRIAAKTTATIRMRINSQLRCDGLSGIPAHIKPQATSLNGARSIEVSSAHWIQSVLGATFKQELKAQSGKENVLSSQIERMSPGREVHPAWRQVKTPVH